MLENPQVGDRARVVDGDLADEETCALVHTGALGTITTVGPYDWVSFREDNSRHPAPWHLQLHHLESVEESS